MNTQELEQEVVRLMRTKEKNEANIPMEQLQTRYKNSYDRLCEDLKDAQCALRARYVEILCGLSGVMGDSVYMDPDEKPGLLDRKLNIEANKFEHDPLALALYVAFYHNYRKEGEQ